MENDPKVVLQDVLRVVDMTALTKDEIITVLNSALAIVRARPVIEARPVGN